jgi:hypothetical protein
MVVIDQGRTLGLVRQADRHVFAITTKVSVSNSYGSVASPGHARAQSDAGLPVNVVSCYDVAAYCR